MCSSDLIRVVVPRDAVVGETTRDAAVPLRPNLRGISQTRERISVVFFAHVVDVLVVPERRNPVAIRNVVVRPPGVGGALRTAQITELLVLVRRAHVVFPRPGRRGSVVI